MRTFRVILAVLVPVLLSPVAAQACSVCYGEPDSAAAKGLTWAIVALGGMVGLVLSGVVMFFVHANRGSGRGKGEGAE